MELIAIRIYGWTNDDYAWTTTTEKEKEEDLGSRISYILSSREGISTRVTVGRWTGG